MCINKKDREILNLKKKKSIILVSYYIDFLFKFMICLLSFLYTFSYLREPMLKKIVKHE
jgi:hypothetical protein